MAPGLLYHLWLETVSGGVTFASTIITFGIRLPDTFAFVDIEGLIIAFGLFGLLLCFSVIILFGKEDDKVV
jgi:hypothetical protein